jgi:hypothetical protein
MKKVKSGLWSSSSLQRGEVLLAGSFAPPKGICGPLRAGDDRLDSGYTPGKETLGRGTGPQYLSSIGQVV